MTQTHGTPGGRRRGAMLERGEEHCAFNTGDETITGVCVAAACRYAGVYAEP